MTHSKPSQKAKAFFWPELFYHSLDRQRGFSLSAKLLTELGEANQNIWDALNIFDDFLDNEGQAEKLPEAISKYRIFVSFFYDLNLGKQFYKIFEAVLKDLDQANCQEVKSRQFNITNQAISLPRNHLAAYTPLINLSRKSLALALAPLAIIFLQPSQPTKQQAEKVLTFFRLSLAAKQLADDSLDWLTDLKHGHLTEANRSVVTQTTDPLVLSDFSGKLHRLFADYAAPDIISNLNSLCQQAREAGKRCGLVPNSPLVQEIIIPLERGISRATSFRQSLEVRL